MKTPNFNNWQVYYMDNDGRKRVIKSGLGYNSAVKLWQQLNSNEPQLNASYEAI